MARTLLSCWTLLGVSAAGVARAKDQPVSIVQALSRVPEHTTEGDYRFRAGVVLAARCELDSVRTRFGALIETNPSIQVIEVNAFARPSRARTPARESGKTLTLRLRPG